MKLGSLDASFSAEHSGIHVVVTFDHVMFSIHEDVQKKPRSNGTVEKNHPELQIW